MAKKIDLKEVISYLLWLFIVMGIYLIFIIGCSAIIKFCIIH